MTAVTLKAGATIAALYTAIIGVGIATMYHGYGYTYGQPEMVKVLLWFEILGAAFLIWVVRRHGGLRSCGFGPIRWGQMIWVVPSFAVVGLMTIRFVPALAGGGLSPDQWLMIGTILAVTVLVGFAEELAFRGILLRGALRGRSVRKAMLISAIGFSLLHAVNVLGGFAPSSVVVQLLLTLIWGLFFAPVALRLGSLWPLVLFHFLWDFLLVSGLYLNVDYTVDIAGTPVPASSLGIAIHIFLAVVLWVKRPVQV